MTTPTINADAAAERVAQLIAQGEADLAMLNEVAAEIEDINDSANEELEAAKAAYQAQCDEIRARRADTVKDRGAKAAEASRRVQGLITAGVFPEDIEIPTISLGRTRSGGNAGHTDAVREFLRDSAGEFSNRSIREATGLTSSQVSGVLASLAKSDEVSSVPNPEDGRGKLWSWAGAED